MKPKFRLLLGMVGGAIVLVVVCWLSIRSMAPGPKGVTMMIPAPQQDQLEGNSAKEPSAAPNDPAPRPAEVFVPSESTEAIPILSESFDGTKTGALPPGWSQWSNNTDTTFGASGALALSPARALAITGRSNAIARAWPGATVAANVQVSSAILLDSLVPAQVLVRGAGLDTDSPSYYAVSVARGLEVQLIRVVKGTSTTLGSVKSAQYFSQKWARATIRAEGSNLRVQVFRFDTSQYLNASGQWQVLPAWSLNVSDSRLTAAGSIGLGKGAGYAGTLYFDDLVAQNPEPLSPTAEPPTPSQPAQPLARANVPRHYDHIRIAMLAYAGTPFTSFEEQLLRNSVDLVIPNTSYLERIKQIAPKTPRLIYTNTSNLYLDLLTDWLAFADRKGYSREAAFYHAARPVKFRGDSPSSRPVTWFWRVYRGGQSLSDVTSAAHTGTSKIAFGAIGEAVYLGYPDRFREININIVGGAGPNWSASMEYPAAVDSNGIPTRWALLGTLSDSTERFSQSGTIIFNPAPDWKPASVDGSDRLYYIRFLTTKDGRAPIAASIRGRDYVGAKGTTSGTIPVFDVVADTNKDGYLNDQEYQRRTPGKDARFLYESRIYTEGYGQMRPATNPSRPAFREWAANYHLRFLARYPLASGLFMDNSGGKAPVQADDAIESVDNYGTDAGLLLATVARAIAPRWIMANVGGAYSRADPVIQQNPAYFEEYGIRPMSHNWAFFEDLASLVAKRATLATPAPLAVLDSHPQRGSVTDPRTQIGALAYYYLLADPETTFLVFFGGYEPATSWTRHWIPAAAYDIGKPTGKWSQRATGPDPANSELSYRLYQRNYEKALVLYKPLSHVRGKTVTASLGDETATRHDLGGTYRPLKTDGTVGNPITSITLRNGEGAILIKVNP